MKFLRYIIPKRIRNGYTLIRSAFGVYKGKIILLAALGFFASLFEAIGVNALIPLFSFFTNDGRGGEDVISQLIAKLFSSVGVPLSLPAILVLISVLFLLKAVLLLIFNQIREIIKASYIERTMRNLFAKTLGAQWSYLLQEKLGYLETVMVIDVRKGAGILNSLASIIATGTGLFVYLIVAFNISQAVTFLTLVAGGFVFLVFKPLLYRARKLAQKTTEVNRQVAHRVNESISGAKTLKAMSAERFIISDGNMLFGRLRELQIKSNFLKQVATLFIQPASVIFISAVVAFSFYQTSYNLGALAAIIYLIQRVFIYIQELQSNIHAINRGVPHLRNVLRYEKETLNAQERSYDAGLPVDTSRHALVFNNVSFSYGSEDAYVLKNINLEINKGELVGIVGQSGSGKTTILDLVLRFFDPTQGDILYDNIPIKNLKLAEWRGKVIYASQDVFLLNDSIFNNIKLYDELITDEEIYKAAKSAHADSFIYNFKDGFGTVVGDRGIKLSAGQRQRIALARALVRKPEILLLDEVTSALDSESEKYIQQTIESLRGSVTILVVTHRPTTLADADKVVVLQGGEIVQSGTPETVFENQKKS